jgi:hypothetical protein
MKVMASKKSMYYLDVRAYSSLAQQRVKANIVIILSIGHAYDGGAQAVHILCCY